MHTQPGKTSPTPMSAWQEMTGQSACINTTHMPSCTQNFSFIYSDNHYSTSYIYSLDSQLLLDYLSYIFFLKNTLICGEGHEVQEAASPCGFPERPHPT